MVLYDFCLDMHYLYNRPKHTVGEKNPKYMFQKPPKYTLTYTIWVYSDFKYSRFGRFKNFLFLVIIAVLGWVRKPLKYNLEWGPPKHNSCQVRFITDQWFLTRRLQEDYNEKSLQLMQNLTLTFWWTKLETHLSFCSEET